MVLRVLDFVVPLIIFIFELIDKKIAKDSEKEYSYISSGFVVVSWLYSFVNIFTDEVIYPILIWMQNHWWVMGIYILLIAVLPSITAQKERMQGTFKAQEDYAVKNRKFNLLGAAASCAVYGLVYIVVGDFSYLKIFYIEDIVPLIASVSVWLAIIYQKIEHKKDKKDKDKEDKDKEDKDKEDKDKEDKDKEDKDKEDKDKDSSLKHMNQRLNLLHLFNVYFLAIISVVYLVTYTIYCNKYHINIVVHPIVPYILITMALSYFYKLLQNEQRYLYLLSLIFIPVILITSVYWMTWFTLSQKMRFWQWLFVFAHTLLYMFGVFKREKVICVGQYNDNENYRGIKIGKWELLSENYFLMGLLIVVGIIYTIVWALPSFINRLPANEANNYIDMICEGTDVDADLVIEMAEEQEMYDETFGNYDVEAFMRFLSEELGEQLLEKGIIGEDGSAPIWDDLRTRLLNAPRKVDEDK